MPSILVDAEYKLTLILQINFETSNIHHLEDEEHQVLFKSPKQEIDDDAFYVDAIAGNNSNEHYHSSLMDSVRYTAQNTKLGYLIYFKEYVSFKRSSPRILVKFTIGKVHSSGFATILILTSDKTSTNIRSGSSITLQAIRILKEAHKQWDQKYCHTHNQNGLWIYINHLALRI